MQKRIKRLLIGTTLSLMKISSIPLGEQAVLCALEDMNTWAAFVDTRRRQEYLSALDKVKRRFGDSCSKEELNCSLDELLKTTKTLPVQTKVDFIVLRRSHWGAVRPLVSAFQNAGCETRIIPTPMLNEGQDNWGREFSKLAANDGFHVVDFRTYNIEEELPDIVVDNMAVDSAKIPEFRFLRIASVTENIVHLEHSILTGYNEAMKRSYFRIGRSRAWLYIVPSPLFRKAFPLVMRIDGDYVAKGYPEMDSVWASQQGGQVQARTTILWNIDALDPEFDLPGDYERLEREIHYLRVVAERFPEILSIVRPHPNFFNQERCQTLLEELMLLIESNQNVVFDYEPTVYSSYKKASAMVTWLSSTTLFTFAATGKPVIVIPTFIRGGYDTILDMRLLNEIPVAYSEKDIIGFVQQIGTDSARERRIAVLTEYSGPVDGTASEKIAQEVLSRYEEQMY